MAIEAVLRDINDAQTGRAPRPLTRQPGLA